MENQDRNLEQQVWQRVKACREDAPRNEFRQLQREAMELTATLAGIGVLSRQHGEQIKLWQPGKENPGKQLERCYHRTRRCMTEYLARSADNEFGVVFEKLAKREGEHCWILAELIGNL